MCVKLSPGYLNSDPYPSHPTSIYTCGMITAEGQKKEEPYQVKDQIGRAHV